MQYVTRYIGPAMLYREASPLRAARYSRLDADLFKRKAAVYPETPPRAWGRRPRFRSFLVRPAVTGRITGKRVASGMAAYLERSRRHPRPSSWPPAPQRLDVGLHG